MRKAGCHICLLIDNFSGHTIGYEPRNIRILFFKPNLTPFVQPLDAGVIRCFKAHYRQAFCKRAIELDEAGKHEIYKNNLLEGMIMAQTAWKEILPSTIEHCWAHTGIQRLVLHAMHPQTNGNSPYSIAGPIIQLLFLRT